MKAKLGLGLRTMPKRHRDKVYCVVKDVRFRISFQTIYWIWVSVGPWGYSWPGGEEKHRFMGCEATRRGTGRNTFWRNQVPKCTGYYSKGKQICIFLRKVCACVPKYRVWNSQKKKKGFALCRWVAGCCKTMEDGLSSWETATIIHAAVTNSNLSFLYLIEV
jgi:hypothetical protein